MSRPDRVPSASFKKFLRGAVMLSSLVAMATQAASAAPIAWPVNGHSYEAVIVPGGITWEAARDAALDKGGYLATLTSAEENAFVHGLVASNPWYWVTIGTAPNQYTSGPWIGLYQPAGSDEPAGDWSWVTGESLDYTNWVVDRPNNLEGIENYGQFFGLGLYDRAATWNDLPNESTDLVSIVATNPVTYIVEYNAVPEPTALVSTLLAALGLLATRRRLA